MSLLLLILLILKIGLQSLINWKQLYGVLDWDLITKYLNFNASSVTNFLGQCTRHLLMNWIFSMPELLSKSKLIIRDSSSNLSAFPYLIFIFSVMSVFDLQCRMSLCLLGLHTLQKICYILVTIFQLIYGYWDQDIFGKNKDLEDLIFFWFLYKI